MKPKTPLPVGTRVAVYDDYRGGVKGTVDTDLTPDGNSVMVTWDNGKHPRTNSITSRVHIKACRRLKKKERRRVFLSKEAFASAHTLRREKFSFSLSRFDDNDIEFIEVKPKEKQK